MQERKVARISGVLLAGGRSRRMGTDKRRLVFSGTSLFARALTTLRQVSDEQVVSVAAASDVEWMRPLIGEARLVVDKLPQAGPLGALVSALPSLSGEWALLFAVDMPCLPPRLFAELLARGDAAAAAAVVPHAGGRLQVLAAAYHRRIWPALVRACDEGERSLARVLADSAGVLQLCEPQWRELVAEDAFANVNSPQDFARLSKDD